MKRIARTIALALSLLAGAAMAALPPLVLESAALDRAYIPALMLSNGKDPAKARAAQERYEQAWSTFEANVRAIAGSDAAWTKTLQDAAKSNAAARAALAAGKMGDAHDAQEEVRHALWHQRQAQGLAYQPDLLTDFHATMELIIASAQDGSGIDATRVEALKAQLARARGQWQAVKGAPWEPADYGFDAGRLESYRAALVAEDRALDELAVALGSGDGPRIAKAAAAIKPPFARAYAAFGVFPQ